ncbi:hypothetical protein ABFV57_32085, partial [Pseudomonas neuropathica]|uniref:hypothetical protein n=1 Tax=Pseudomonas neuropathica TaxID=2730425 RepID=UPI0034D4F6E0
NETDLAGTAKHHCQLGSAAHDWRIAMNQFAILYGDRFTRLNWLKRLNTNPVVQPNSSSLSHSHRD